MLKIKIIFLFCLLFFSSFKAICSNHSSNFEIAKFISQTLSIYNDSNDEYYDSPESRQIESTRSYNENWLYNYPELFILLQEHSNFNDIDARDTIVDALERNIEYFSGFYLKSEINERQSTQEPNYQLVFTPASYEFGQVELGDSQTQSVTVRNGGTGAVTFVSGYPRVVTLLSPNPYSLSSTNCGTGLAPGASCSITVTFTPQKSGDASGFIGIYINETTTLYTAHFNGSGVGDFTYALTFTPASYEFGQVELGDSQTQSVTVRNGGTGAVTFVSGYPRVVTLLSPNPYSLSSTNCGTGLAPGASCSITVTFTPQKSGDASGFIGIYINETTTLYTAHFNGSGVGNETFNLTIAKSGTGTGSITSDPSGINCGNDCAHAFVMDTDISLSGTADTNSVFDGWSGDADCEDGQVTMDTNKSCTATFNAIRQLTVTSTGKGNGTVTSTPAGINCGATCQAPFYLGTTVKLMAKPDATSIFAGWSGDAGCPNPKLDQNRSCTATFNPKVFRLYTFVAGTGGGTLTSNPAGINCGTDCEEDYVANTLITLTATPDARSSFAGWAGPCTGTAPICQVTMSEVRGVTAIFNLKTYTLRVAKLGDGVVTSNPVGISCGTYCRDTFEDGTPVSLTALPALGSGFVKWSGACTGTGRVCTVTMNAAKNVTATFVPLKITINDVTQSEGNSGTRAFNFTVSLNASTHRTVKVSFATRNGTAQAGTDYNARTGLVAFTADQIAKPLGIAVRGDIVKESNETFFVNLATPVGATFAKQQGKGIITNDD